MSHDTGYERKLELALQELEASALHPSTYLPPAYRWLGKVGIKMPPPHYGSFWGNAVVTGSSVILAWGVVVALFSAYLQTMPPLILIVSTLVVGAAFGAFMAVRFQRAAAEHKLSNWDDLG
jgi:hypothetical protein